MTILNLQSGNTSNLYMVNKQIKSLLKELCKSFKLMKPLQVARFAEGKKKLGGPPTSSSLLPLPVGGAAEQDAKCSRPFQKQTLKKS